MNKFARFSKSPAGFFCLVFALAIPFWLVGARSGLSLLPHLPAAALSAVCPAVAALILVFASRGSAGAKDLLSRSFDYRRVRNKIWFAPTLLLMPCVMLLSYGVMRVTGVPVPTPQSSFMVVLELFFGFLLFALGEELGWSGYAIDPLQCSMGALPAAIFIGLVWVTFHIPPLLQADRSATWIAWWGLGSIGARVLIVWLYNNSGESVFVATLFHTTINVTWLLFPVWGSYYDPRITGAITALFALIVTILWGPRTLRGHKTSWVKRPRQARP